MPPTWRACSTTCVEARAALASEASGQRGGSIVRAHSASEDARDRADDTRPGPSSSARAALPGASFVSLQVGPHAADVAARLADFAETAGAVAALDLVITVDTAVAHLAGALGKPTWVLLPEVTD